MTHDNDEGLKTSVDTAKHPGDNNDDEHCNKRRKTEETGQGDTNKVETIAATRSTDEPLAKESNKVRTIL